METIEIQLDKQTLERARQLATSRSSTIEALIAEMIEQLGAARSETDPFLGMFAQESELIDEMMESAMKARENHPLRQPHG